MIGASVIGHLYVLKYIQEETSLDNRQKNQQGSPLTPGCHLGGGGGQVYPLTPKTRLSNTPLPPPPPLSPSPILARIGFLSLTTIQHHRLIIMECCAYKVEKISASAPVWLYTSLLEPTTSTSRMFQNQSQSIYIFF